MGGDFKKLKTRKMISKFKITNINNKIIYGFLILFTFLLSILLLATFFSKELHFFFEKHLHLSENPSKVFVYLGVAFSGSILALQQFFFFRRVKANESIAISQQSGVFQERFNYAITHLGSSKLSVRLGGIYTLAHLGSDEQGNYLKSVIEILCAHLRSTTQNQSYQNLNKKKPSIEIQTILDILFNNDKKSLNVLANYNVDIDLTNAYLVGVRFNKSHLQKVNFSASFLSHSCVNNSKCMMTVFDDCKFNNTILTNSDFTGAQFVCALFYNCRFEKNKMFNNIFLGSIIYSSAFQDIELQGSKLEMLFCLKVNFYNTNLSMPTYDHASFNSCVFQKCQFSKKVWYNTLDFITRIRNSENLITNEKEHIETLKNYFYSNELISSEIDKIIEFLNDNINDDEIQILKKLKIEKNRTQNKYVDCKYFFTKEESKLWEKEYLKSLKDL